MIRRIARRIYRTIRPKKGSPPPSPSRPPTTAPPPAPAAVEEPEPEVEIDGEGVAALRAEGRELVFVDIREPHEIRSGHIAGATLIPMNQVPERLAELPQDRTLIVYCAAGARSFGVSHYLREQGYAEAWSLIGGIGAWLEQDRDAWLPPPSHARFPPTTPARLTEAAAARLGRDGPRAGTVQEVREGDDGSGGALVYTLGIGGERIGGLAEDELEGIGRSPRR